MCGLPHCCSGMAVPGVMTEDYALNRVLFRSTARLSAGPAAAVAGAVRDLPNFFIRNRTDCME